MADEQTTEARPNGRKVREGIVVSAKMDKTVVVAVVETPSAVESPAAEETVEVTTEAAPEAVTPEAPAAASEGDDA